MTLKPHGVMGAISELFVDKGTMEASWLKSEIYPYFISLYVRSGIMFTTCGNQHPGPSLYSPDLARNYIRVIAIWLWYTNGDGLSFKPFLRFNMSRHGS